METIVEYAQGLVYSLLCLMPSMYQKASLNALFGRFLEAQGHPLPQHTQVKSASSLSRFLNHYNWSTRSVIRSTRRRVLQQIAQHLPHPKIPLRVLIDLTCLEKCGKFLQLSTPTANPDAPDPCLLIGECPSVVGQRQNGVGASRHRIWHSRLSQCSAPTRLATDCGNARQS